MLQAELGTVVTYNPLSVSPDTTLADLLRLWTTMNYCSWPVVDDEQRLVGMVTDLDIVRAIEDQLANVSPTIQLGEQQLAKSVVQDFMSAQPVTVSRWDLRNNALYLMLKHRMHSLPVVEEDRLVGLVATTDFLREFSYGELSISRQHASDHAEDVTDPLDCEASLEDARKSMDAAGTELVGVVSGSFPLGVVTRRDVRLARCRIAMRDRVQDEFFLPGPCTLRELAAQSPALRPGAKLSEAANLMVEHRRQALSVVNQAGRLIGVVTEAGILRAMVGRESWQDGNR